MLTAACHMRWPCVSTAKIWTLDLGIRETSHTCGKDGSLEVLTQHMPGDGRKWICSWGLSLAGAPRGTGDFLLLISFPFSTENKPSLKEFILM